MTQLRVLTGADIRRAVTMREMIEAMRDAFIALSAGRVRMPIRSAIDFPEAEGTALFMPAAQEGGGYFSVKTVNLFPGNRAMALPFIQGLVCLFDAATGTPVALLEATTLTAMRTGAACGLATELLARPEAAVVTIIGAGTQGRTQLEAVCAVRTIKRAYIYDLNEKLAARFASEMSALLGVEVVAASSVGQAVRAADILCTATVSSVPVFDDSDTRPGLHLNAIGSYKPHVQEVPADTVFRSRVFVDHVESALEEAGDLLVPIRSGLITRWHIVAEIGKVAANHVSGRLSTSEVTFFKSVGVAVQDLAAAGLAFERAREAGLGSVVEC